MRYENKVVKVDRENIDELKSIIGVSGPAGRGQGGGYHHDLSDSVRSRPEALSGDDMVDCGQGQAYGGMVMVLGGRMSRNS